MLPSLPRWQLCASVSVKDFRDGFWSAFGTSSLKGFVCFQSERNRLRETAVVLPPEGCLASSQRESCKAFMCDRHRAAKRDADTFSEGLSWKSGGMIPPAFRSHSGMVANGFQTAFKACHWRAQRKGIEVIPKQRHAGNGSRRRGHGIGNRECSQTRSHTCSLCRSFTRSNRERGCVCGLLVYLFFPQRLRGAGAFIRQAHSTPGHFMCLSRGWIGSLCSLCSTHCSVAPDHGSGHIKWPGLAPAPRLASSVFARTPLPSAWLCRASEVTHLCFCGCVLSAV